MHSILNRSSVIRQFAGNLVPLVIFVVGARADIYQWEYINPADPSQGKRQSTALAPDGAGVDAVPGADLSGRNLTMADLVGADLTDADGIGTDLTNADLRQANLTNAILNGVTLLNADFTGAQLRGANFGTRYCGPGSCGQGGTGITLEQIYSTASYKASDLSGVGLSGSNLSVGNFAGKNFANADFGDADLTGANFRHANLNNTKFFTYINSCSYADICWGLSDINRARLTEAEFSDADVRGASFSGLTVAQLYSTASYRAQDLSGIDVRHSNLVGGNFAGQNLSNASFYGAELTDADFTDAEVRRTNFSKDDSTFHNFFGNSLIVGTGIALAQLYSTASYRVHDLSGVNLALNDLTGGILAGQNLTNTNFAGATLSRANLTGADARAAYFGPIPSDAIATNLIRPDGHINGLGLNAGSTLVVRDYDGDSRYQPARPPLSIRVDQHFAMGPDGTLRMVFEADAWDSTISFAPGIPVALGGTLELTFAADINSASQVGRTFHIFDWTDVEPSGAFDVSSPYDWDLSHLYTTGEVTLTAIPEPNALLLLSITLAMILATRGTSQHRLVRVLKVAGSLVTILACTTGTRADIFQWEYINPADPTQGKGQSATLAPDGADVYAMRGANLSNRDLTKAHLIGADLSPGYAFCTPLMPCPPPTVTNLAGTNLTDADLTSANLYQAYVVDANLRNANLTNADFSRATLTNASFIGAEVRGARFARDRNDLYGGSGISLAQLYSTASYKAHELSGTGLGGIDFSGANFASQNLSSAWFSDVTLTDADFRQAKLINAKFGQTNLGSANLARANFAGANLTRAAFSFAMLTDADFRNANLTNADFRYTTLAGANFAGAEVRGASLGITLAQLYSTASYQARDLQGARLSGDFRGGNFAGQNLTNATLSSTLTSADLTNAVIRGANLGYSGLSLAQLYSTASYQAHDLSGTGLNEINLAGGDFAGHNLTNAHFYNATLIGADFTNALVQGADFSDTTDGGFTSAQFYSTASYQSHDLTGVALVANDLTGWNFAGQNLTGANVGGTLANANFSQANLTGANVSGNLTGANFSGAEVRGASLSGIATTQLYSTASYQAHDLTGIKLNSQDLNGANFASQKLSDAAFVGSKLSDSDFKDATLTNAYFNSAILTGSSFRGANLANARFFNIVAGVPNIFPPVSPYFPAMIIDANLTAADARGALGLDVSNATTTNLIRPDGHISGLDLSAENLLVIRDHDGNPRDEYDSPISPVPIPITIDEHLATDTAGTLRLLFKADDWNSTISFAPGIPVALGGTLELTFAADVNPASQLGRTLKIFDWTGVTPTGTFIVSSPYAWNLSNLYITGEVTLTAIPEPTALILFSIGLVALFPMRRVPLCKSRRPLRTVATLCPLVAFAASTRADIFQWEYIDPYHVSHDKQQSTTLALDGAGVDAAPGADLSLRYLSKAFLPNAPLDQANLSGSNLTFAYLAGSTFRQANLLNVDFGIATLTGVDFAGAEIRGAKFSTDDPPGFCCLEREVGSGITIAQLYSTASYQAGELIGINFDYNDLAGGNFSGQIVTNASFVSAKLTDTLFNQTNLSNSNLRFANLARADFNKATVSHTSFEQANLTGATFRTADLIHANFEGAELTDAAFGSAKLRGTNFSKAETYWNSFTPTQFPSVSGTGVSLAQLYSTASYQARDLKELNFRYNDFAGGNFVGQNLENARFGGATLTDADFTGGEIRGADFAIIQRASFFGWIPFGTGITLAQLYSTASYQNHDLRGVSGLNLSNATTANLILPNGRIDGLNLDAGGQLLVRDYDGPSEYGDTYPPITITVDEHLIIGPGGTLRMVFEADAWDSTISFAPGIQVTLGGTLELTFASDLNPASQVGRTFDLFYWTGVSPTGAFTVSSPYTWNLSSLYTIGEVTLTAVPEPASFAFVAISLLVFMPRRVHRITALMKRPTHALTKIVSLTLVLAIQQGSSHAAALRTVALSGQPAPGTPAGATFSSFGAHFLFNVPDEVFRGPVINDAGRIAFRADLTGGGVDSASNQGIWSEGSGTLALVARTSSPAVGAPDGVNFSRNPVLELFEPVINGAGQTAFYGGLTDGSVGLWSEGSGSLALVARDGSHAPGTPVGVNHSFELFRDYYMDQPKLNDAGRSAFWANLTGGGVNNTNDWGVWSESSGSLGLVARSGSPAPGTSAGVNFDSFFVQTAYNDVGQTAFFANLTGSGVDPSNDNGVWAESAGNLRLVARSGMPAPGTPSGVTFRDHYPPVTINNAGRVAFETWVTGDGVDATNEFGLWSEGSGTLALVARIGSPAPGTAAGVKFATLSSTFGPVLNDAGQTAFRAELTGSGVNATNFRGIWIGGAESLTLAVRTGSPAPGTPNGVRFNDLSRPSLNNMGQLAFRANLTGSGISSSNNLGIWASDQTGGLQLIARTGSQLEVAPGVVRTISDLGFVTDTGNCDGRASGFNNLGQLVFWARFMNGTQGVFVSSVAAHLPGDFNNDGTVDAADYVLWRKSDGMQTGYDAWRANFGRILFTGSGSGLFVAEQLSSGVPEPAGVALATLGLCAVIMRRRKRISVQLHTSRFGRSRKALAMATAIGAAIQLAPTTDALGITIEFDESAESSSAITFDPDARFDAQSGYVSGRIMTNVRGPIVGGTNINTLLGADAFYSHGYTGANAVIANIEDGHIWSGHETLAHVQQIPSSPLTLNEFDRHATRVGSVLGGRQGGANPGPYQEGMAPDAQLYSGALATQWNGPRHTGDWTSSDAIKFDQFRKAFSTGLNASGRTADVINSSWGSSAGANGSDAIAIGTDGFVNANPHTLFVSIAHNFGPGPDRVTSPGSAYNSLCVAALGRNPPYDSPAWFSSGGPNDYFDSINGTKNDARQVVDIAAPGENLSAAYYGGETGGNGTTDNPLEGGPGPTGPPRGSLGGPDYYSRGGLSGTSLAAPTVAGGAALLYDAAYSVFSTNAAARDARVMKAVLMNTADKTAGWNNGQFAHPNGNGGVLTTQGLDNRVGTGRLNLHAAYDQFLTGTTDIAGISSGNLGVVSDFGWDFGQVVSGTTNDYFFNAPLPGGSTFTATLTWFRDRQINASNTLFDDSFDDLNLELWRVVAGVPTSLISESSSLYNESEHFSFTLPVTGDYALRVRWFKEVFDKVADANQELYGLAWWAGPDSKRRQFPNRRLWCC